jgi:hypothetical protein
MVRNDVKENKGIRLDMVKLGIMLDMVKFRE